MLGCTKVFQPLVRQFFLLPDYKTCICRGNFLLSREFRRQFPDNLWRGPHWGNVASWVSSAIVLCGVILRKWPHVVIIIDASSLSLSSSWMTQSQVDFGAKYDTHRIEWRAHLINLHHGIIFNLMGRHVFLPFLQKTGGWKRKSTLRIWCLLLKMFFWQKLPSQISFSMFWLAKVVLLSILVSPCQMRICDDKFKLY